MHGRPITCVVVGWGMATYGERLQVGCRAPALLVEGFRFSPWYLQLGKPPASKPRDPHPELIKVPVNHTAS